MIYLQCTPRQYTPRQLVFRYRTLLAAAVLGVGLLLASLPLYGQDARQSIPDSQTKAASTSEASTSETAVSDDVLNDADFLENSGAVGSTIFVDPDTGELTANPTPEQEALFLEQLRLERLRLQSKAGFQDVESESSTTFPLQSGGEGLYLGGSWMSSTVLIRDPDGNWTWECQHGDLEEDLHAAHPGVHQVSPQPSPAAEPGHDSAPVM